MKLSQKTMKFLNIFILLILIIIGIIWVFGDRIFTEDQRFTAYVLQMVLLGGTASIAAGIFLYLTMLFKPSTEAGKIWLFFGLGIGLWAIAEYIYCIYQLMELEPFPSIAVFFYMGGYVFIFIALFIQMRLTKIVLKTNEKIVIALGYLLLFIIVLIGTIIYPIIIYFPIPEEELFNYFLGTLSPLFDLVLIFCSIIVFMKLRRGQLNIAWSLLLTALLLMSIGDIIFMWQQTIVATDVLFYPFDYLYIINYTLLALSGIYFNNLYYSE